MPVENESDQPTEAPFIRRKNSGGDVTDPLFSRRKHRGGGKYLLELRKACGLTQSELGLVIQTPPNKISSWERTVTAIPPDINMVIVAVGIFVQENGRLPVTDEMDRVHAYSTMLLEERSTSREYQANLAKSRERTHTPATLVPPTFATHTFFLGIAIGIIISVAISILALYKHGLL
jgi:transcriptional regulator with XRE-family HTH domain